MASQLSVVEINVITKFKPLLLAEKGKTKILTWTKGIHTHLHVLPVQMILHCLKRISSFKLHMDSQEILLNLYVPGTHNTKINMAALDFKEFKV